jgi:hypothetical protein
VTSRRQSYEGDYTATPEEHENRAEVAHILEEDEIKQSYRDAIASPIISLRGTLGCFNLLNSEELRRGL